jgi:hypothetical protein
LALLDKKRREGNEGDALYLEVLDLLNCSPIKSTLNLDMFRYKKKVKRSLTVKKLRSVK